jgi:hypothetical protein
MYMYIPAGHGKQSAPLPPTEKVPAGHLTQVPADAESEYPGAHEQASMCICMYVYAYVCIWASVAKSGYAVAHK